MDEETGMRNDGANQVFRYLPPLALAMLSDLRKSS